MYKTTIFAVVAEEASMKSLVLRRNGYVFKNAIFYRVLLIGIFYNNALRWM